ncbi:alpha/beta hydrolase [Compostimonas suwonensis]|uniref:Acetyl esterase n=1 Tax=Compostimonas suwonensis TaxID=1048394 RepID=A0A2M9BZW0_9MICO|nr:alpha/beta hydrolase [Compostimonas suwonensis]PJJ63606.1 acetyl esterase [Compostimonas suwonensis]
MLIEDIPAPQPLDEESQRFLALRREANLKDVYEGTVAEARAGRTSWRTAFKKSSPEVAIVRETTLPRLAGDGPDIPARIYRDTESGLLPSTVFLHGGGWVLGGLDHSDAVCRWIAKLSGTAVINVDYRRAPETRFPGALDDSYSVTLWASAGDDDFGLAPRTAVMGCSAGGNLAAAVALMARDRRTPAISAQVLVYPVVDTTQSTESFRTYSDGYIGSVRESQWYWTQYLGESPVEITPYAAPSLASTLAGLPTALVMTAEYDQLRDEGEIYARRLAADGVDTELVRCPGSVHTFFTMPGVFPQSDIAIARASAFLAKHLAA